MADSLPVKKAQFINGLELLAVYLALRTVCPKIHNSHRLSEFCQTDQPVLYCLHYTKMATGSPQFCFHPLIVRFMKGVY